MKAKNSLMAFLCPELTYYILNIRACLIALLIMPGTFSVARQTPYRLSGTVTSASDKKPLPGATVKIENQKNAVYTDNEGKFTITTTASEGTLLINFIGFKPAKVSFNTASQAPISVALSEDDKMLQEVQISTGFQNLPRERATGSFVQIDNELLNRRVSTNILDRLDGVTSGMIFTNNNAKQFAQSDIEIRGRATLFSNPQPLIVVDNFPYDGELSNINPNDITTITILKDAASASIWGSRSGNGVIVITTKRGTLNAPAKVNFNANITIGDKPDLYYTPQLSSEEYIDVEQFMFNQGAYWMISDGFSQLSPAVEIFHKTQTGQISSSDSLAMINILKGYDSREQILKYYYRPSVYQQYQANINGGSANQKYFVSAGYDKNLNNFVNNSFDRITFNASNTYYFLNNKMELFSNIIYTGSKSRSGPVISTTDYPYDQLADADGNPMAIGRTLRPDYANTIGDGQLLNWIYKPLEELNNGYSNTKSNLTDYRINVSLSYNIINGLKASALYTYEKGVDESNNLNELESYYTRDLINTYTQINSTTGVVTYPVPMGAVLYTRLTNIKSHNGRFQLNYDNIWGKHLISALTGTEIRDYTSFISTLGLYGYDPETATNQNASVNYTADYPYFYGWNTGRIPTNTAQSGTTNRFLSTYFNGSYTYDGKYIASLSIRRDESNLFGVDANQKGVPLWSAGGAWFLNKESFYHIGWLSQLKVRATYGYTGNVNNNISAYLTAIGGNLFQDYNAFSAGIVNPPNPSLRWEKVRNLNLGFNFNTKNSRLSGSVDLWSKSGIDLIGNSPIAPQTGITEYTGNSANTLTKGVDVQLNSINLNGDFKWFSNLLYNYSHSRVTEYKVSNGTNYDVVSANYNNPLKGYPYYAMFSFRYAGLNETGDPQGYLHGEISTDYTGIANSTDREELVYHGSATPTHFGSLRNSFLYKGFDLSFNIIYKFGYYFRRSSLNNGTIYSTGGNNYQMADYEKRWQQPGDELLTDVPALVYPASVRRTSLYTLSDVLVEKGDHFRLQDIRLGYTPAQKDWLPLHRLTLFTYINNIGILWRANKHQTDPDYPTGVPVARTITFGLRADL